MNSLQSYAKKNNGINIAHTALRLKYISLRFACNVIVSYFLDMKMCHNWLSLRNSVLTHCDKRTKVLSQ